jgi:phosphoribosylaminoimidazole-succinocarboxamide synthase
MSQKGTLVYEGKAKKLFEVVNEPDRVWVEYKDSLTAFNAQKKGEFSGKGRLNRDVTVLIYNYLAQRGVPTHLDEAVESNSLICQKLQMIPLEVVVRNKLAGSTAKKFEIPEGQTLRKPLVEFYYKKDELNDPFMSDEQALMLECVSTQADLDDLKTAARKINDQLRILFKEIDLDLIDFKLEFGRNKKNEIILADEITPDSCRLWDLKTNEKMDKDRFRRDLGGVREAYEEVWNRLKKRWEK